MSELLGPLDRGEKYGHPLNDAFKLGEVSGGGTGLSEGDTIPLCYGHRSRATTLRFYRQQRFLLALEIGGVIQ